MAHWLMKSEPYKFSWSQLVMDKRNAWDGVRNYQAANNLKAMRIGDQAFFYHSNEGLEIVGIMEIAKEAYPDPSDPTGRFVMVDVVPIRAVGKPVTLKQVKAEPLLADLALVRHSRLSVSPVSDIHWTIICRMAEVVA